MTLGKNYFKIGNYVINLSNVIAVQPWYETEGYKKYYQGCQVNYLTENGIHTLKFAISEENYQVLLSKVESMSTDNE